MSAFIVGDDTINTVVSHLATMEKWKRGDIKGYDLDNHEDVERLAKDMFSMNVDAVRGRYNNDLEGFRPLDFECKSRRPQSDIRAYKALCCFLYQCAETCIDGHIPDRQLYKDLKAIQHRLADIIVSKLPEYADAPWGD